LHHRPILRKAAYRIIIRWSLRLVFGFTSEKGFFPSTFFQIPIPSTRTGHQTFFKVVAMRQPEANHPLIFYWFTIFAN